MTQVLAPTTVVAAPARPVLTQAEAKAVLDVLQNDAKRAQFVTVLQGIIKAQTTAPRTVGLAPGSLGAELLAASSSAITRAADELLKTARTLSHFALARAWLNATLADPSSRLLIIDALKTLAIVTVAGGVGEWLTRRALSSWRDGVNRYAAHEDVANIVPEASRSDPPPTPDATGPDADLSRSRIAPGRPSSWVLLRRMPYVGLRFLIDCAPVLAFGAIVYAALATPLGSAREPRLVVIGLVDAYLAVSIGTALLRALLSPRTTSLRLVHMSDASAAYLLRWGRRFLAIGIFGYAIDRVGLLFGMYETVHDALVKIIALAIHLLAIIVVLQCKAKVARRLRAQPGAHGAVALLRNRMAESWHLVAIFCIVTFWLVWAFEVPGGYSIIGRNLVIFSVVLAVTRLMSIVLLGGLDRMLRFRPETVARYPGLNVRADRYTPLLKAFINAAVLIFAIVALLQFYDIPVMNWAGSGTLGSRILSALAKSGLVTLIAVLLWEGANAGTQAHLARLAGAREFSRAARLQTLLPLMRTTLMVVIVTVAALMILSQIGINTAPLLAGAGVVGIAIGFGSQKLVQDIITGLFLLLENAMQVGDTISLAGLTGTVENLSVRTIRLRAVDGAVHLIPFSSVTTVTNATRDYGYAVLDVTVGYNEEPDHIAAVLREIGAEMREDPRWRDALEGDLDVQGVDKFLDNAWVLRVRIRTLPSERLPVQREFNRRLKYRFDQLAIESPFTSPRILSTNPPLLTTVDGSPERLQ